MVEVWFNDSVSNYKNIFDANFPSHQLDSGPRLEQNAGGGLKWYTTASTTGTSNNSLSLTTSLSAGSVHRGTVIVYDHDNYLFDGYFDNTRVINSQQRTNGDGNLPFNNVALGAGYNTTRYYDGKIHAVRIYNRALSQAEVEQNYDAHKIRFNTYSSTFTPQFEGTEGKVEVLCVAGGGGGGRQHAKVAVVLVD